MSDATNVYRYLTTNLRVPKEHIELLLSATSQSCNRAPAATSIPATRSNIVNTLLRLCTNSQIQNGDNVVIYFSGHGASYLCSDHPAYVFPADKGTIEALCPTDRNPLSTDKDKRIPDISDRELSTILTEICRTKGHHITVILDCCHSSSATRNVIAGGSVGIVRKAQDLHEASAIADMFAAADKSLGELKANDGSPRYGSVSAGNWKAESKKSHVALAACQSFEFATEVQAANTGAYGVFTAALLHKLEEIDKLEACELPTYDALIKSLPENDDQYPWAIGDHKKERLWFTV